MTNTNNFKKYDMVLGHLCPLHYCVNMRENNVNMRSNYDTHERNYVAKWHVESIFILIEYC